MNILIVDDEVAIRNGIKQGIDWAAFGVEKVLVASDGLEAHDLFIRFAPELVITDVRMPGLDGIELARKIRETSKTTKILILSAYSDFAYAKSALRLGVNDYELKPLKLSRLMAIIHKFFAEIEAEKVESLQAQQFTAMRRSSFLANLMESGKLPEQEIIRGFDTLFHFSVTDPLWCLLLQLDCPYPSRRHMRPEQLAEMHQAIEHLTRTYWKTVPVLFSPVRENTFLCLLKHPDAANNDDTFQPIIKSFHDYLNQHTSRLFSHTVSLGAGTSLAVNSVSALVLAAHQALRQKFFAGFASLHFAETHRAFWHEDVLAWPDEAGISEAIQTGNLTGVLVLLASFFHTLKEQQCINIEYVRNTCLRLKGLLIKGLKERGLESRAFFEQHAFTTLAPYDILDEYQHWLVEVYQRAFTELIGVQRITYSPAILQAIEYIRDNFSRNISAEEVAHSIEKSPNYFSHCFNKELGISFREYLNKVRVEAAKRLLRTTNLKGYEIAREVGFQDYTYFIQVFKKIEKVAPSEYRNPGSSLLQKQSPPPIKENTNFS